MKTKVENEIPLDEENIINGIKENNQKIKSIIEEREQQLSELGFKLSRIEQYIADIDEKNISNDNSCYFKTEIEKYGTAQIRMYFNLSNNEDNDDEPKESEDDITYTYYTSFDATVPQEPIGNFWNQFKYWLKTFGEVTDKKDLFEINFRVKVKHDIIISTEVKIHCRNKYRFLEWDNDKSFIKSDGKIYNQYFKILENIINNDIKEKVLRCKYKQSELDYKRLTEN